MRVILGTAIGLALAACLMACNGGSEDGVDGSGGDGRDAVDVRKATVDAVARELLPALAGAADGEFPFIAGGFSQCDVGQTNLHYVVDGEVHGDRSPDSAVRSMAGVAEDQGFTITRGPADLGFVAERDDLRLAISAYPQEVAGQTITVVNLKTDCQVYSREDADRAESLPQEVYGKPLRPQG